MKTVCGLDVHKSSIFCCILNETSEKILEQRFGTLTPDLLNLREVLLVFCFFFDNQIVNCF